ncbi:MAG TPA: type II toxin-antitoxin system HicB family antitoxin [Geminicoccaceae bacterium]|nr:type II toxin-antitoxin system HicB family antitoxin [Geminicoccaceae bacterium]
MTGSIALQRKDPDSDFGVDFPDFPGCITAAGSPAEAKERAAEALRFHIEGMTGDGESIPPPGGIEEILADPDNADALPFVVTVDVPEDKAVRVTVEFKESFLRELDAAARARRLSRSAFLARAAEAAMRRE